MQLISYQMGDDEGNELYIIAAEDRVSARMLVGKQGHLFDVASATGLLRSIRNAGGVGWFGWCGWRGYRQSIKLCDYVGLMAQVVGMCLEELAVHLPDAGATYPNHSPSHSLYHLPSHSFYHSPSHSLYHLSSHSLYRSLSQYLYSVH